MHIFSSAAGNFIVCTSKEGFKRIALESWPGSSLHIVLVFAEENTEEGGKHTETASNVFH